MGRRAAAVMTALVSVAFSTSCMTWGHKDLWTAADHPRPNKAVAGVVLKSGEVIAFSRRAPARIVGDRVVGTPSTLRQREVEIAGPFPSIMRPSDGKISQVTDANGRVWKVLEVLKEGPNTMTVRVAEAAGPVSVPLSDVSRIMIKRSNPFLSFLTGLGFAGAAWMTWMAVSLGKD